jgi:hypothetical protein
MLVAFFLMSTENSVIKKKHHLRVMHSCFDSETEIKCRPSSKELDMGLCGIVNIPFITSKIFFFENLILVQIEC